MPCWKFKKVLNVVEALSKFDWTDDGIDALAGSGNWAAASLVQTGWNAFANWSGLGANWQISDETVSFCQDASSIIGSVLFELALFSPWF